MADYTSNLFLAIHARDLTGPGFLGASTHLRTFGAIGAVALGGIVVASLKAASNFQTMTQSIANNTTMGQGGLDQMRASILRLGNDSNVPLDQLGQGYMRATNLGYGARDATDILTSAMKSAASTGSNTADTTNTLASVMHEFNLQGGAAAKTMDTLHLASALGNTTLEQFTTGGNKAIAMAANLGVPLNQVTAALSAMTRHGSIENASTTIVGALSKIVNPAKAAQKELASLTLKTGIDLLGDFTPAGLKAKGLTGILADLKAATNGNAQEIFKLIPALRGGQAAMILTGNGAKDYSGILASLGGVTDKSGITAKAYAATQKTASFQFGELRNKVQILAIALGTQLLPYAAAAASWLGAHLPQAVAALTPRLTVLISAGTAVGRAFVAAGGAMVRVASGLRGLIAPLLGVSTHLGTTRQGTAQLGAGLALLIPALVGIKVGMLAWTVAQSAWTIAQTAGTIAVTLWKNAVVIAGVAVKAYAAVNEALSLAILAVRLGLVQQTVQQVLSATWTGIVRVATTAWTLSLGLLRGAMLLTTAGGTSMVLGMIAFNTWGLLVKGATALWTGAQWLLNAALYANPIGLVIAAVAGLVAGVIWAYKNVSWFHDAVNKAWTFLSSVFAPGLGTVASGLKNVLGGALDWVTNKVKGLIDFFGNLLHMVSSIPGVKDAIGAAYKAAGVSPTGTRTGAHGAANHPASQTGGVNLLAARLRGREGYGTGSSGVPAPTQHVLGYHAAAAAHHGLNAAQRAAQTYLSGKPKARTPLQVAQLGVQTDTALWKQGRRSDGQITHDIAVLAKLDPKKAALLQAQFNNAVHHRNEVIRHAAAARQQRSQHRNDAIAHAGAVKAHHDKMVAAHQQTVDLGALYHRDSMTLQTDMRDRNFAAARQVVAAMTSIKAALEIQRGVSKGQAAKDARAWSDDQLSKIHSAATKPARADLSTLSGVVKHWRDMFMADKKAGNTSGELADLAKFKTADLAYQKALRPKNGALAVTLANDDWNKLGGALSNGLKKLTAHPMGSGFHRSVYGYTSRQQVGQGVGLGETLVTFGGRVGKDPAQQMIDKLETQVQQLTRQNQALTALLGAVEDGTAATISVRDAIKGASRAMPGAGIGNPLRVAGLATAVR